MPKEIRQVNTEHAPQAIGPYSQAVLAGPFLFISGQIPIDPRIGRITSSTIEGQTQQVLKNIQAILEAAHLSFVDVVKTEIFLKEMKDFSAMDVIYAEYFSHEIRPARSTIQAAKLPMDCLVEISCIAYHN